MVIGRRRSTPVLGLLERNSVPESTVRNRFETKNKEARPQAWWRIAARFVTWPVFPHVRLKRFQKHRVVRQEKRDPCR